MPSVKSRASRAVEFILARGTLPILYWLKKDILGVPVERECRNLQKFAARVRILESQKPDGTWSRKRGGPPERDNAGYLIETLKNINRLYDLGCTLEYENVRKPLRALLMTQTAEGDFRGAGWNEYSPIFHSLTLETLCRFGLDDERKVQNGFQWLVKTRQTDGGWAIPYRTVDIEKLRSRYKSTRRKSPPLKPNKKKPSSHLVTGIALRALAESEHWRKSKEARRAGEFLLSRFFCDDAYDDRKNCRHWEELNYPFWATNILSSLDALSKSNFQPEHKQVRKALEWLLTRQNSYGFWEAAQRRTAIEDHLWVTLAVLRVLKRFGLL